MQSEQEKLAYVLGSLYGDGCFAHKDQNGRVHFGSTDIEFVEEISKFIREIFSLQLRIRVNKLSSKNPKWRDYHSFSSRRLYKFISRYDWKISKEIPEFINNGRDEIKAAFVKGFFDAEGNVNIHVVKRKDGRSEIQRRVSCFSNDTVLLERLKEILRDLEIQSEIFHNKRKTFYLGIWNYKSIKAFYEKVNFSIKRKSNTLENAVNGYKEIQTRWDDETYNNVIRLRNQGLGARKIRDALAEQRIKISIPTIESWIYRNCKPLKAEVQIDGRRTRNAVYSKSTA